VLETPNLHELNLDRIIAFGHTWSPAFELLPVPPLRHGHAIAIDMAYTATLSMTRGLLTAEEHSRLLGLFSRAGLAIDHEVFNDETLAIGTKKILETRAGRLRVAVPGPLGSCTFVNEYTDEELAEVLKKHKDICKTYPRGGAGVEAYVDADGAEADAAFGVNGASAGNGAVTNPSALGNGADTPAAKGGMILESIKEVLVGPGGNANGNSL
jgi:3-dehydroquinate synthase